LYETQGKKYDLETTAIGGKEEEERKVFSGFKTRTSGG
jgi:hypothetical protein